MAIPESQLNTWSHQGSITQSAATYSAIRSVLSSPNAPYSAQSIDIYLQGSYGNNTNIYADSDVDIVICIDSVYYSDTSNLQPHEKSNFEKKWSAATYTFAEFKRDVLAWLQKNYGSSVSEGTKAISIEGNGNRRDADVLVCAQHKRYTSFREFESPTSHDGIVFWTTAGKEIINFPKQHMANCTDKHQACNSHFKPNVRVLKNLKRRMVSDGIISRQQAPSYFLEGMLWNVPNSNFTASFQQSFLNYFVWLNECSPTELTCANGLHWLIRDGADVCWNRNDFDLTRQALWKLWSEWS